MKSNKALKYIRLAETLDKHGDFAFSEVAFSLAHSSSNLRFAENETEEQDEVYNHILGARKDSELKSPLDLIYSPDYFMAESSTGPKEDVAHYEFPQYSDSQDITHQTWSSQLNIPQTEINHRIIAENSFGLIHVNATPDDILDELRYSLSEIKENSYPNEETSKSYILHYLKYTLKIVNADNSLVDYIYSVFGNLNENINNIYDQLKPYIQEINNFKEEVFNSPNVKEAVERQFDKFKKIWNGVIEYFDKTGAELPEQYKDWQFIYQKFIQELKNIAVSYGVKFITSDNLIKYLSENWDFIKKYAPFYLVDNDTTRNEDRKKENEVKFHGNTKEEKDYFNLLKEQYPNLFKHGTDNLYFYKNDLKFFKEHNTDPNLVRSYAGSNPLKFVNSSKIPMALEAISKANAWNNCDIISSFIDKTDSVDTLVYGLGILSSNILYKLSPFSKISNNTIDLVVFAQPEIYNFVKDYDLQENLSNIPSIEKYSEQEEFIKDLVVNKYSELKAVYEYIDPYVYKVIDFYPGLLFGIKYLIDNDAFDDGKHLHDSEFSGGTNLSILSRIEILDSVKNIVLSKYIKNFYGDERIPYRDPLYNFKIPARDLSEVKNYVDDRFENNNFSNQEYTKNLILNLHANNNMDYLKDYSVGEQDFIFSYCLKKSNLSLETFSRNIADSLKRYFEEAKNALQEIKIKNNFLGKDTDGNFTIPQRQDVKDSYLTVVSSNFDSFKNLPQAGVQDLIIYLKQLEFNGEFYPANLNTELINYLGNALMIFGKMTVNFLKRYPANSLHDKTVMLPSLKEFNPEIRDFILNNILRSTKDIALYLTGFWNEEIVFEGNNAKVSDHIKNKADLKKLEMTVRLVNFSTDHGDYKDETFAVEFIKSANKKNPLYKDTTSRGFKYSDMEEWYTLTKNMPLPIWARNVTSSNGFVAKFLPKKDTRNMFAGKFTGCCQTLYHYAQSCAFDTQLSPKSALFVILNNKNEMYAQSYVWESETGSTIVIDSMEFKPGLTPEVKILINDIYLDFFKSFDNYGRIVNFGKNTIPGNKVEEIDSYTDNVATNPFRSSEYWKKFANNYTSDSLRQYQLKSTKNRKIFLPNFQTSYSNLSKEELVEMIQLYRHGDNLNFFDLLALAPIETLQQAIPKEEFDIKMALKIYRKDPSKIMSPEIKADLMTIFEYIIDKI